MKSKRRALATACTLAGLIAASGCVDQQKEVATYRKVIDGEVGEVLRAYLAIEPCAPAIHTWTTTDAPQEGGFMPLRLSAAGTSSVSAR